MSGHARERADNFDVQKGIAALAYLAEQTSESMYTLLKMMYLADKLHLQRFGRFISGDHYCAMKQGPVPSNAYGIFQHLRGEVSRPQFAIAATVFDYRPKSDHAVALLAPPELDELSRGELECLATIVDTYRKYGKWAVRDLSHDEAWESVWKSTFFRKSRPLDAKDIAQHFDNAEALVEHLADPHPGTAELPEGYGVESVKIFDRVA